MRIASIVGTRPEAIKLAPVALEAACRPAIDHRLIVTGQHGTLADAALADFGLLADERLAVASLPAPSLDALDALLEAAILPVLDRVAPDLVLVQGDTASAFAGARAAHRLGLPIGHVEAGLRSFDLANPFPEERNRIAIDRLATLLFAPTPEAARNLRAEPDVTGAILITGNTGIDALLSIRSGLTPSPPLARPLILATCHRRESFDAGIAGICEGLARIALRGDVDILLPVHPNPAVRDIVRARLGETRGVRLTDPLPYPDMVAAMAAAHLILTDSGGIQEEAPALGVPVLVLRDVTERPEGVASGNLALVGTDPARIAAAANLLLDDPVAHARMARPERPFGDGLASARIIDACLDLAGSGMIRLPAGRQRRNGAPEVTVQDDRI